MIQQLCIDTNHIQKLVSEMSFAKNGDNNEHKYGSTFKNQFPNCELFWQQIIVPVTNRIDPTKTQGWEQIKRRVGVSDDVLNMIYLHYTIFLHLVYAFDHLSNPRISSFVNFYTHLGSICDLAEDFLLQIYLIVNECKNCTSPLLQEMKKEAFIEIAGKWYDKKYPEFYENYHKKGKSSPIHIPSRDYILREYFPESSDWTSYINFSKSLR